MDTLHVMAISKFNGISSNYLRENSFLFIIIIPPSIKPNGLLLWQTKILGHLFFWTTQLYLPICWQYKIIAVGIVCRSIRFTWFFDWSLCLSMNCIILVSQIPSLCHQFVYYPREYNLLLISEIRSRACYFSNIFIH